MSPKQITKSATLKAQNVGGIDGTKVTFSPGVTVLKGENATNRTSLLRAIMAALGSDQVSVKGDADEAFVELEIDGETYTRKLSRNGSTIQATGEPYLEGPKLADLFAFLLESNEARRAVVNKDDLRELIMRPVDTDEIQREIDRLVEERRNVEERLEELDSLKDRLRSLEECRTQLREDIEAKREELADKEADIEERDADVEEKREEKEALEDELDELRSKRSNLEDVRYDIETERESLESMRDEKREAESALEELPDAPIGKIEELESELEQFRERKRYLESDVNEIQSVIGFNQEMLKDADADVLDALEAPPEDVTEELLPDDTITCWTCGSEVPEEQIETTVGRLQELSQSKLGEVNEIESSIDELNVEISELREQQRRREELERDIEQAERDIDQAESRIDNLGERREALHAEIEELEAEIEEMEDEAYEEVLDLHREANQLEYEVGRLESDLEDVEDEIAEIESSLDEESDLEARRDDIGEEIEELRTKIERIETRTIEEFNHHMDSVLEMLEYANLERIWLERVEREVREGRRKVTKSVFELHIVRQTKSGATYEDTVDHLSESEREVTGLVFALSGYLAHKVYDEVPFMLLDSLEAIDSSRIARLVVYLEEFSDYLLITLLTEDAESLPDEYDRLTEI
jgi:chromosome segregation ATPase